MGGIGELISAAAARAKAKRKAQVAKKAKRTEVRDKKKANRKEGKARAKEIRQDAPKDLKRTALATNRVFHKSDKEGNKGGQEAVNVIRARKKAQLDRKAKRDERKAARKDK